MSTCVTRKPRKEGVARRLRILAFLRENPGASHRQIAEGVGLAVTGNGYASILETHLGVLECEGRVEQVASTRTVRCWRGSRTVEVTGWRATV